MVNDDLFKNCVAVFKTTLTYSSIFMANLFKQCGVLLILGISQNAFCQNLAELYQSAQQNNQHWLAQQFDYLGKSIDETLVFGDLLPQIGLQGSIKHNHFDSQHQENSQSTLSQVGIGFRQALWRSDKVQTLAKANIAQDIHEITLLKQQQQLAEQVVKAYLAVLKAQAINESLQVEYTALQAQHNMMQARLAEGIVAKVDTEETYARLQSVYALIANNDVAILTAKQQLALVTGEIIENIQPLQAEFNTDLVAPKSLQQYLDIAKNDNFDLQLAQTQVNLARANQDYLKSHLYPKVDLVADIGWQENSNHNLKASNGINYGVGVELQLPLYTGGRTLKGLEQGAYQTESAISQLKFAYQQVMTKTSQAYLNVMAQKTTITAQQTAVKANQQVANASQTGYDLGMRSMVDTLLAQRQYHNAKRELINAYFDYLNAYVDLQVTTGQLNDETIQKINDLLENPEQREETT